MIINLDSKFGKKLGFTSDKFSPKSYLWKDKDRIIISVIESKEEGRGYFSELMNNIKAEGYTIAVPTPIGAMCEIVRKKGFKKTFEYSKDFECDVEMWIK